ncbi:MAG: glycosyl hydrolase [Pseudonocardiales bacterium]|nr:MAG: glycosyl hydrolase [Pseudonocardiales bacterium]
MTIALTAGSLTVASPSDASFGASTTDPAAAAPCPVNPNAQKSELRATWIASVANIDWPSKPGLTAEQQQAELSGWLDMAVAQQHNAVFLQVRPTADAFWPHALEPWSKFLTGTAGADPGFDPLGFAVTQAHKRNLELHAWFNPYRVSMDQDLSKLAPDSPARTHPDWVVPYGGKLYYNPGVPAARTFVEDAIMNAVTKYDIDGVHFDDYFYPYPVAGQAFPDDAQFAAYGSGFPSRADWRRDNVNKLITELGSRIKAAKPWVKFGVSPFAVWRNKATDPLGSDTTAGAQTYDDLYANTRRWVRESWIDYIAPQIYWSEGFAPADYDNLVPWWSDVVRGTNVHLYIGQATYKIGTSTQSPGWSVAQEMSNHLTFNSAVPEVKGNIYFSAKDVRADRLGATTLLNQQHYAHPALVPAMTWLDNRAPKSPKALSARVTSSSVRVTWRAGDMSTTSYAVYRLPAAPGRVHATDCRIADATHLVATMRATGRAQAWTDPSAEPGQRYTYVVTGLDRTWNESAPAQVTTRR